MKHTSKIRNGSFSAKDAGYSTEGWLSHYAYDPEEAKFLQTLRIAEALERIARILALATEDESAKISRKPFIRARNQSL
jgi:hypothetical protein